MPNLTQRETQVLRLLADGNSYRSIADRLGVSINTVHAHQEALSQARRAHGRGGRHARRRHALARWP
jgi:DNA-binding NarL/FixJ family response regulator